VEAPKSNTQGLLEEVINALVLEVNPCRVV